MRDSSAGSTTSFELELVECTCPVKPREAGNHDVVPRYVAEKETPTRKSNEMMHNSHSQVAGAEARQALISLT